MAEETVRCEMPTCWNPRGPDHTAPSGDWSLTRDHIVPLAEGGPNTASNRRPAHRLCNRLDYSIRIGRSHRRDDARIAAAAAAMEAMDA